MVVDLSNPGRTLHAGVILMGETEVLDVAPIDFLHGMTKRFVSALLVPDELKAKGLDMEFHWVTEKGTPAQLTSNMTLNATVSLYVHILRPPLTQSRTPSRPAHPLTSS